MKTLLYVLIQIIVISSLNNCYAQLPNIDSLINIVINNNHAELTQLNDNVKKYREKSWINLIPNLGYDFLNNRPFVSINISSALGYINSKRQTKYKQLTNAINYSNNLTTDTLKLKAEYYKLQNLISQYNDVKNQLKYDSLYLSIKQKENKNLQTNSETVIKAQQTKEENQIKLYNLKNQLISQKLVLESILKKELPLIVPQ